MNGKDVGEIDPNTPLELDEFNLDKVYDIIAKVKKPGRIGNMKVALVPVFGLKKRSQNKA